MRVAEAEERHDDKYWQTVEKHEVVLLGIQRSDGSLQELDHPKDIADNKENVREVEEPDELHPVSTHGARAHCRVARNAYVEYGCYDDEDDRKDDVMADACGDDFRGKVPKALARVTRTGEQSTSCRLLFRLSFSSR